MQLGVLLDVRAADVDETVKPGESPADYVRRMAFTKAEAGFRAAADCGGEQPAVLGADTSVVLEERIFGKPADEAEAAQMLDLLSGKVHQVLSAVVVTDGRYTGEALSMTDVRFRYLQADEIAAYWRSGEPCDKAGAYGIQGFGAVFVEEIRGSYTGVVGLPLFETAQLLSECGVRYGVGRP